MIIKNRYNYLTIKEVNSNKIRLIINFNNFITKSKVTY